MAFIKPVDWCMSPHKPVSNKSFVKVKGWTGFYFEMFFVANKRFLPWGFGPVTQGFVSRYSLCLQSWLQPQAHRGD